MMNTKSLSFGLKKKELFGILYLMPEVLIGIGIFRIYLHRIDLWVLSALFIYEYVLVYYKIKFKKFSHIMLKLAPLIIICLFYFTNLSATVTLLFTLIVYVRGFIYRRQRITEYSLFKFFLEAFIFAIIAAVFDIGFIFIYAVILKLICLILVNITVNADDRVDGMDKAIILLNLVVVVLYPFGRLFTIIGNVIFSHTQGVLSRLFYGIGVVLDAIITYMPHRLLEAIQKAYELLIDFFSIIFGAINSANNHLSDILKIHNNFLFGKIFITLFYLISAALIVWVVIFILTGSEEKESNENDDYIEEILKLNNAYIKKSESLSEIRKLYKNILKYAVKCGYKLKKSSTARSVGAFLQESKTDIETLDEINDIYENERYAKRSKTTADDYKKLCDKLISSKKRS